MNIKRAAAYGRQRRDFVPDLNEKLRELVEGQAVVRVRVVQVEQLLDLKPSSSK